MLLPENVVSVCIFGSMARGDHDERSDADVLVVVRDRSGKISEKVVSDFVRPWVGRTPTISWYGQKRLQEMFESGHLFAWHLYYECRPVWGPLSIQEIFGRPAPYEDALLDISSFQEVMADIPAALQHCPRNVVYEMGLLYVCVRNIAMSASWHMCDKPDFTRYSPFHLGQRKFGASRAEYALAMLCRMASQRGIRISDSVECNRVFHLQEALFLWSQDITADVEENVRQQSSQSKS